MSKFGCIRFAFRFIPSLLISAGTLSVVDASFFSRGVEPSLPDGHTAPLLPSEPVGDEDVVGINTPAPLLPSEPVGNSSFVTVVGALSGETVFEGYV